MYDVFHVHLSPPLPLPLSLSIPLLYNQICSASSTIVFHHSPIQMPPTAMASSEGATDVSTEERLERKRFEIAGMITILAKRLNMDDWPIDERDHGARDPYRKLVEDQLAEFVHQHETLTAQLDSIRGPGEATTTINESNVGFGSTPGDGSSSIARLEADKAALRRERELGAGKVCSDDGHGEATATNKEINVGAGSTSAPGNLCSARKRAELRRQGLLGQNDGGAGSTSGHGNEHPYIARKKAELRGEREMGAEQISLDNSGAGSTSKHEHSCVSRKLAEIRRQHELGAGKVSQDDEHKAATTISNGHDPGAGNTTTTPQIIVCTPEDVFGADATANNGRGLGAGSTSTPVPDNARGILINPFNGDYLIPGSTGTLRQRGSGRHVTFQTPDDVLRAAGRANGPFENHVARLHAELAELENDNNFTGFEKMLVVWISVAVSAFVVGVYFHS